MIKGKDFHISMGDDVRLYTFDTYLSNIAKHPYYTPETRYESTGYHGYYTQYNGHIYKYIVHINPHNFNKLKEMICEILYSPDENYPIKVSDIISEEFQKIKYLVFSDIVMENLL